MLGCCVADAGSIAWDEGDGGVGGGEVGENGRGGLIPSFDEELRSETAAERVARLRDLEGVGDEVEQLRLHNLRRVLGCLCLGDVLWYRAVGEGMATKGGRIKSRGRDGPGMTKVPAAERCRRV